SGLATPPGRTRTSMSAAVASPVVRSTGCVPAAVRWSTRPASPDEVLTRTGVCPASVTASHGSVSSTLSIPSPATRKAIVRLSVCASWFSVIPRLCVHACWSATAGAGWDQRQAGPVGASPPDSLALSTLSGSRRGSRRRRTSSAPDHREKPADAPTDSRDARPVGGAGAHGGRRRRGPLARGHGLHVGPGGVPGRRASATGRAGPVLRALPPALWVPVLLPAVRRAGLCAPGPAARRRRAGRLDRRHDRRRVGDPRHGSGPPVPAPRRDRRARP